jgi:FtsP/CotA-like multicopper oxidase with cupredoxin domain
MIEVSSGARERWHFTNASNGRYFELQLPGHSFTVIGTDGGLIERVYDVETLRIAPGKRYDIVVTLVGASGQELALGTLPVARGMAYDDKIHSVLTLRFGEQTADDAPLDERLPVSDLERIPVDELTPVQRFELELDAGSLGQRFVMDDYIGSATTVSDGTFAISFDDAAFREFFDRIPDRYFKVYCRNELLAPIPGFIRSTSPEEGSLAANWHKIKQFSPVKDSPCIRLF